jgi:hypothetical protein
MTTRKYLLVATILEMEGKIGKKKGHNASMETRLYMKPPRMANETN